MEKKPRIMTQRILYAPWIVLLRKPFHINDTQWINRWTNLHILCCRWHLIDELWNILSSFCHGRIVSIWKKVKEALQFTLCGQISMLCLYGIFYPSAPLVTDCLMLVTIPTVLCWFFCHAHPLELSILFIPQILTDNISASKTDDKLYHSATNVKTASDEESWFSHHTGLFTKWKTSRQTSTIILPPCHYTGHTTLQH